MAETIPFKYRAFLSYSHRDKSWGEWLHRALESYRIDKDLIGRATPDGPVPRTLRPIFRDREDFSAGHSLTEQTLAALDASQFLIVVCSPNAAHSHYVNEEIRRFKTLGRSDRVIPVIVSGEPGDPARECFPPALRFKVGADGTLTEEREEPIAADAREQGDGKELAKQKVVAGLLGVGLDEIVRRGERARKRRNRFWAALAGVFLVLALTATGSAVYAWQQLKTNEIFLNATLKRATEIVDEAVAQAEKYSIPRAATLALLARAEGLFDDMARYGRPTPELRYRKAWMLIQFARNYSILGDSNQQRERAVEAQRLLVDLVAEKPDDPTYQRDLSVAHNEVGDVLSTHGDLAGALAAFRDSYAILLRLITAENAADVGLGADMSYTLNRIGDVLYVQGEMAEAQKTFETSLAIMKLLVAHNNSDEWQRDFAYAHYKYGRVLFAQGLMVDALNAFRSGFSIIQGLVKTDPKNPFWRSDLGDGHQLIGNALNAHGDFDAALKEYEAYRAIYEQLVTADPSNLNWLNELAISHRQIGDMLKRQGKPDAALAAYRAAFEMTQRLVAADSKNTDWWANLGRTHEDIGHVFKESGRFAEALKEFEAKRAIFTRLAELYPHNNDWQHDLAASHRTIGETLIEQGNVPQGIAALRAGLAIMERLPPAALAKIEWQLQVVFLHVLLAQQGDDTNARVAYALAAIRKLQAANMLTPSLLKLVAQVEEYVAKIEVPLPPG